MKKRVLVALLATALTVSMMTGCGSKKTEDTSSTKTEETSEDSDQEAADKVAKLIDDIYVRTLIRIILEGIQAMHRKMIR